MNEFNIFIQKNNYNIDDKYLDFLWNSYYKNNTKWITIDDEMIKYITGFIGDVKSREFYNKKKDLKTYIHRNYIENEDYVEKKSQDIKQHGGQNKKYISMHIDAFKGLLMKRDKRIREYFSQIEHLLYKFYRTKCDNYEKELNELRNMNHIKIFTSEQDKKHVMLDCNINIGYVYFIYEENNYKYFKIGFTKKTVIMRLKQLQTGNRRKLYIYEIIKTYNPRLLEYSLHLILRKYRIDKTEWFNINCDVINNLITNMSYYKKIK